MAINNGSLVVSGPIQHKRGTSVVLIASDFVPAAGEIVIATDTGEIRAGDGVRTWANLPSYEGTEIVNSLAETEEGKALDAVQGKELNDKISALNTKVSTIENISSIDCGEITD